MRSRRISRRAVLLGLGGVGVALPALEIMLPRSARADILPRRFVLSYAGTSLGVASTKYVVPSGVGSYELTPGLAPLGDHGVQSEVTIVSGMKIPWQTTGEIPPGGRPRNFHYYSVSPQIAGTHSELDVSDGGDSVGRNVPLEPTADQILVEALSPDTKFDVLVYRVHAMEAGHFAQRLSWRRTQDGGVEQVDPIFSPRLAYESLFTGFAPADPAELAEAQFQLERKRSVLDLVHQRTERLLPLLGRADRERLERHFDEIRAMENRLAELTPGSGACTLLDPPGDDPATEEGHVNGGYSGEKERAEVFTDLIAMAFACDLSRIASFQITDWKSYLNMQTLYGPVLQAHLQDPDSEQHAISHSGRVSDEELGLGGATSSALADVNVHFHVDIIARLVKKLRDVADIDGSSVLDHTALVMLFEGGQGYNPESDPPAENDSHSTVNMMALVAGGAGGLQRGVHIVAADRHPAEVVISAMNAAGYQESTLGEVSGGIAELFGS